MCFPFPPGKGKHINNLTPTHFRDNPAKLFMFIGFFLLPDKFREKGRKISEKVESVEIRLLSDPTEIPPRYRETGVAIPLSHCVSGGIADYRCYTPTSCLKTWPIAIQRQA